MSSEIDTEVCDMPVAKAFTACPGEQPSRHSGNMVGSPGPW